MTQYLIAKNDTGQELTLTTINFETNKVLICCKNGVELIPFVVSKEEITKLIEKIRNKNV